MTGLDSFTAVIRSKSSLINQHIVNVMKDVVCTCVLFACSS